MFGVLVDWEGDAGMTFELFDDIDEAMGYANDTACAGFDAKLFDYDKESGQFMEWFS